MADSNASKLSALPIFIVDAFTNRPFKGNSAAVCLLRYRQVVSQDVKQKIASEMNLSETAFLSVIDESDTYERRNRFALQWFTPKCEVPLCGHATLASAAVLFSVFKNQCSVLEFQTASGLLKARQLTETKIEIDLPAYESKPVDTTKYEALIKAVVRCLPFEDVVLSDSRKLLLRLKDSVTRQQLQQIKPRDHDLLSASTSDVLGVIVTLRGSGKEDCMDEEGKPYDFMSRYFAPWVGISEDPVTGSAHSVLAPFWSKVLKKKQLYARQCSPRGGDLGVHLTGDQRVAISGDSAVVLRGEISF